MTQKFIVVFATCKTDFEKEHSEILNYGYAFSKTQAALDCIAIARHKAKELKEILVGVWSCEWGDPRADYKVLFADPTLTASQRDKPEGDYAELIRKTSKVKPHIRARLSPPESNLTVISRDPSPTKPPPAPSWCPFIVEKAVAPSNEEDNEHGAAT